MNRDTFPSPAIVVLLPRSDFMNEVKNSMRVLL